MKSTIVRLILIPLFLFPLVNSHSQCTKAAILDRSFSISSILYFIDLEERQISFSQLVSKEAWTVAVSPDGKYAYVGMEGTGGVECFDIESGELISSISTSSVYNMKVSSDGETLYVLASSGSVTIIDLTINEIVQIIPNVSSFLSTGIYLSYDDEFLIVSGYNGVVKMNISDFSVEILTDEVGERFNVAITCDNKLALVSEYSGTIEVYDLDQNNLVRTIDVDSKPSTIVMSPDQRFAYISLPIEEKIAKLNLQTFEIDNLINLSGRPSGIGISTDGSELYIPLINGFMSVIDTDINLEIETFEVSESLTGRGTITCLSCNENIQIDELTIPTMSQWGLISLFLIFLILATTHITAIIPKELI